MADEVFDPWETGTGLIEEGVLKVSEARFGYDAQYQDGTVCLLILEGTIDAGDGPAEQTLMYSCGKGWEDADKGSRLVREDGKQRKINKTSGYGTWIEAVKAIPGAMDALRDKGDPFHASLWEGTTWYVKNVEFEYNIRGEDKPRTTSRLLPVEYNPNGTGEAEAAPAKAAEPAKAEAKGATPVDAPPAEDTGNVPGKVRVALKKLAAEVKAAGGNHDTFVERAYELDGVDGNAAVEAAVDATGDGSIWASAEG